MACENLEFSLSRLPQQLHPLPQPTSFEQQQQKQRTNNNRAPLARYTDDLNVTFKINTRVETLHYKRWKVIFSVMRRETIPTKIHWHVSTYLSVFCVLVRLDIAPFAIRKFFSFFCVGLVFLFASASMFLLCVFFQLFSKVLFKNCSRTAHFTLPMVKISNKLCLTNEKKKKTIHFFW